jgi:hypothetical protein
MLFSPARFWLLLLFTALLFGFSQKTLAQGSLSSGDSVRYILTDMQVQLDATQAVNDLYNFQFAKAERQFRWLKQQFPRHPLPYFLLALSEWWKIVPNPELEVHDERFLSYLDTSIRFAELMLDTNGQNKEALFFLAAAYGFKGRLYSDRKQWRKATFAGRLAVKYMNESRGSHALSPEFLFGEALYNYYSVWVPENYAMLRPIVAFFPKGDKQLGLQQLRETALNAFYTRTEAQVFLMKIYANDEKRPEEATEIAGYLHRTFPGNAYFHRYYARMLFTQGKLYDCEKICLDIMAKLDSGMVGYEAVTGRYAAFFLGYTYKNLYRNTEKARTYYKATIRYSEQSGSVKAGYYLYALSYMGGIYEEEGNLYQASVHYQKILNSKEKDSPAYKDAQEFFKSNKKRKLKKLKPTVEE